MRHRIVSGLYNEYDKCTSTLKTALLDVQQVKVANDSMSKMAKDAILYS